MDAAGYEQLETNIKTAREIIESGEELSYMPTLDNIEQYATLIKPAEKPKAWEKEENKDEA